MSRVLTNITHIENRLAVLLNLHCWSPVRTTDKLEWPVLLVRLDLLVLELTTDETLEAEDGVLGVDNRLTLRRETDETLAVLGECDHGGRRPVALRVLNDSGSLALHDGDTRVCCTQVNADDGAADLAVHVTRNHGARDLGERARAQRLGAEGAGGGEHGGRR